MNVSKMSYQFKIIIIDDDPEILKRIRKGFDDVILLKDTTLVV